NCGDTARVTINVFPSISADFSFAYDTCVAGPVQFTDLSMSGSGNIVAWDWQFGDGQRSSARNPAHTYRIPGNIPVTLTVTDVNGCQASITKVVPYFPVPSLIVIAPSSFTGCPAEIFFDNLSFPIDETYDILWEFGDGATGTAISPTHTYTETGVYTVSVRIISPIGCQTDTVFNSLIRVLPSPVAGFEYTPDDPTSINNTVIFSDRSEGANRWFWDFGN
ncbi:MAG TPA: PKD domain-containing protein, partial [Saprospiraceae bacterium]|nr:PKD domain-containing protein [Saprospiraceae bacterium]